MSTKKPALGRGLSALLESSDTDFSSKSLHDNASEILGSIAQIKLEEIEASDNEGTLESMLNPLGIAGRIMMLQDYEHDNSLGLIYDILGKKNFDVIRFAYHPAKETERASMTFHLTQREKKDILNSFYLPKNQESLKRLIEVISAGE